MSSQPELTQAVRDGITRAAAVVALAGVALVHVLDAVRSRTRPTRAGSTSA
jgi:hypothetical protein